MIGSVLAGAGQHSETKILIPMLILKMMPVSRIDPSARTIVVPISLVPNHLRMLVFLLLVRGLSPLVRAKHPVATTLAANTSLTYLICLFKCIVLFNFYYYSGFGRGQK